MEPNAYTDLSNYELENIAKRRITDYYRLNTFNRVDDSRQPVDMNTDDSRYQDKYLELFDKYDINLQILLDLFPSIIDDLKVGLSEFEKENKLINFDEPDKLEDIDISNHWTDDIKKKLDQDLHNSEINKINGIMSKPSRKIVNNATILKLVDVSARASQQGQQLFRLSQKLLSVSDMTEQYLKDFKRSQKTLIEYQEDFFHYSQIDTLFDALTKDYKGKNIERLFTDAYNRKLDVIENSYKNIIRDIDNLVKMNDDVILQHDDVIGVKSVISEDNKLVAGRRSMPVRFM